MSPHCNNSQSFLLGWYHMLRSCHIRFTMNTNCWKGKAVHVRLLVVITSRTWEFFAVSNFSHLASWIVITSRNSAVQSNNVQIQCTLLSKSKQLIYSWFYFIKLKWFCMWALNKWLYPCCNKSSCSSNMTQMQHYHELDCELSFNNPAWRCSENQGI